ncbi:hypothetical protein LIZ76_14320 [Caldibacillus sp. 210928-DFI.2.22]|uniref:hypothetical protein n=1 Tax=unclassified Caldibacillus TaxID=2641266 RepID=UPI001D079A61|nr:MULTISPECIES: hypothetical protein [unclassified Caldibacillus]MCB7071118.1 hypothetical protein [Caldibacillus sp. 210928-DFI.2.22]MCB7074575.1 hypothetical protein [Caldibacillus sp. 210928-DFI.2.18]
MNKFLALHETLELHELLTFKSLCLSKSTLMSGLVQDEELKTILLNDVKAGEEGVKRLENLIRWDGQ